MCLVSKAPTHSAHRLGGCAPRKLHITLRVWQERQGIEPAQAVLETASPTLEHSPLYTLYFLLGLRALISRINFQSLFTAQTMSKHSRFELSLSHSLRKVELSLAVRRLRGIFSFFILRRLLSDHRPQRHHAQSCIHGRSPIPCRNKPHDTGSYFPKT